MSLLAYISGIITVWRCSLTTTSWITKATRWLTVTKRRFAWKTSSACPARPNVTSASDTAIRVRLEIIGPPFVFWPTVGRERGHGFVTLWDDGKEHWQFEFVNIKKMSMKLKKLAVKASIHHCLSCVTCKKNREVIACLVNIKITQR